MADGERQVVMVDDALRKKVVLGLVGSWFGYGSTWGHMESRGVTCHVQLKNWPDACDWSMI